MFRNVSSSHLAGILLFWFLPVAAAEEGVLGTLWFNEVPVQLHHVSASARQDLDLGSYVVTLTLTDRPPKAKDSPAEMEASSASVITVFISEAVFAGEVSPDYVMLRRGRHAGSVPVKSSKIRGHAIWNRGMLDVTARSTTPIQTNGNKWRFDFIVRVPLEKPKEE